MANRVRALDWGKTALGAAELWPGAVRTAINNILSSPFPACGCFGEALVMVYNDSFAPILGDKHPALGESFAETWKEAWHIIGPIAHKALNGESTFIQDFPLQVMRNGATLEQAYFTFSYSPLHDESGAVIGVLDSVFETTATVEIERRLDSRAASLSKEARRSELARERMWLQSVDAIVVLNRKSQVQAVNPALCKLLGWDEADLLGKSFAEIADVGNSAALEAEVARSDSSQTVFELEVLMIRKDGSRTAVHWSGARQEGLMLLFGRDLTAQQEAAELLRTTELALLQSQKLESLGQLTGGVAHDFNNLLQVISGNLQLLALEVAGNDRARARLDGAMSGVERGARLASYLLAFSRKQALDPKVVGIGMVVAAVEDTLKRALGGACEVDVKIARGAWNAWVDAAQLENALLNLCINARDAMDGNGRLSIEVGNTELDDRYAAQNVDVEPGEYVRLAVSDTGLGMSPEVIEKAFEPFFTTKPAGKGTGLGLSMVFGFVKQSGGHVKIYSETGHGTTVKLYFPRSRERVVPDQETVISADLVGGRETILVVEDDFDVQETVVELLRQLGYNVLKANEAMGALAIVESGVPVDLLFTDVIMPGPLRSPALAEKARAAQPGIAVLFTSGFTENAVVHAGRLDEGVDLLAKPYTQHALAQKVRRVLIAQAHRNATVPERDEDISNSPALQHVLFVDDDPSIRDVTEALIVAMGYRVTVAGDVEEALQLFSSEITVLVADVNLPGRSGKDLAELIRAKDARIGVVFASGADVDVPFADAIVLRKPYEPAALDQAIKTVGLRSKASDRE